MPTPGVTGVVGVTGVPGVPGVPGEFGGIVELGDKGTWLRITSISSSGDVARAFTAKKRQVMTMVYKLYLNILQKICICSSMKTRLNFSKDDFVISFPCPQKEKWGFFRTFPFYLCVLTESLSPWNAEFWSWKPLHRECTAAILLTLSQHMSHHEILQCSPHNMVGPGRGT